MNSQELYINGILADIDKTSVLALNFAVNTLFDMSSIQGNISNKIVLPPTEKNFAALGHINDLNIDLSNTIRKRNTCKYVQNGVEVIPLGTIDLGTVNSKGIEVTLTSGNIDFFDSIDKGNITDLNLSEFDHFFTKEDIVASLGRISGYTYPVIDYGTLTDTPDVEISLLRPAVFLKTVVDRILLESGFTLVNWLETDKRTQFRYNNLMLPFSHSEFIHAKRGAYDVSNNYVKAVSNDNSSYGTNPGAKVIQFPTIDDPSGSFSAGVYTSKLQMKVDVNVNIIEAVLALQTNQSGKEGLEINVYKNSEIVATFKKNLQNTQLYNPNFYTDIVLQALDVPLIPGDTISVKIEFFSSGRTVRILTPSTLTITPKPRKEVVYGDSVEIEANLPDISKKDFMKAVASMFCALIQSDNTTKTVYIVPFNNIPENSYNAKDWTDRVINIKDEAKDVSIGDYGQLNTAEYKNDDVITPVNYAWGTLPIADENLKSTKTLFTLPFSASIDVVKLGGVQMAQIAKIDPTKTPLEFSISTNDRILMRRFISGVPISFKLASQNYSITIDNTIPIGYFAPDLLLENVLADNYTALTIVFNDQRKLTVPMKLTEVDISELNFFIPVYLKQYAASFYISQIKNYLQDTTCSAELVKLY